MPLYRTFKEQDGLEIGIWEIKETEADFQHLLSSEEQEEARMGVSSPKRILERYATRALLHAITGKHLKINYDNNGRPFLSENGQISISHCEGFAAVILHPNYRLGIDIELLSPQAYKVRNHIFNSREIEQFSPNEQEIMPTLFWCAKEVAYKNLGKEVYNYKKTLEVQPFIYSNNGSLNVNATLNDRLVPLTMSYKKIGNLFLVWGWTD